MGSDGSTSYWLVELRGGVPTGWRYQYNDVAKARKKAEALNRIEGDVSYEVRTEKAAEDRQNGYALRYTPKVIGFAVPRLPLPGVEIRGKCPNCGDDYERDLGEYPACYPVANAIFEFEAYCMSCRHEWNIPMFMELRVRLPTEQDWKKNAEHESDLNVLRKHKESTDCFCRECQDDKLDSEFSASGPGVDEEEDEDEEDFGESDPDEEDEDDE